MQDKFLLTHKGSINLANIVNIGAFGAKATKTSCHRVITPIYNVIQLKSTHMMIHKCLELESASHIGIGFTHLKTSFGKRRGHAIF